MKLNTPSTTTSGEENEQRKASEQILRDIKEKAQENIYKAMNATLVHSKDHRKEMRKLCENIQKVMDEGFKKGTYEKFLEVKG